MVDNKCLFEVEPELVLCICTYKRPQLLALLLRDVLLQTVQPGTIIIVDGDPSSCQVLELLHRIEFPKGTFVHYVPSNHPNLSYQRYLGWLVVHERNVSFFLYLDDDLRLSDRNAISKVIQPLTWKHEKIVGVTAQTVTGDTAKLGEQKILIEIRNQSNLGPSFLVRHFGAAKNIQPGGLSPSGHRKEPLPNSQGFAEVQWLQGRVMAYSFQALKAECFSDDFFAITEINCGLGEDTFLSTRVGVFGKMLYLFETGFLHPDDALPNSYPIRSYKFGYATAYSRRILNDNCRPGQSPTLHDRYSLVKSFLGTILLNWWNAFSGFQQHRLAYAWGYTVGAVRGLVQSPTARNLTPNIDWWAESKKAMAQVVIVQ